MTTAEQTGYAFKSGNLARWSQHRQNPIQRTPDALFRKLDAEFSFTLDAAASDANAKCERYFSSNYVFPISIAVFRPRTSGERVSLL